MVLLIWFIQGIARAISSWFTSTTDGSVVSSSLSVEATGDIHGVIHVEVSWNSIDALLPLMMTIFLIMREILSSIRIVLISTNTQVVLITMNWIACTSLLPLLSHFGLGNSL